MGPDTVNDGLGEQDIPVAASTTEADTWVERGHAFDAEWRHEEALAAFDRALEADPNNAVAWRGKGRALHALKRYQESVDSLERATALNPTDAASWAEIVVPLAMLKRCDEAMAARERGNALVSDWKDFVLWFEGDEEFPAYLECQAAYHPTNSDGWRIKARALSSLDRTTDAVACLEEALRLYPDDVDLWEDQAGYLSDLKRYDEAIRAFDRALALKPDDAGLWAEQARQLVDLECYDEALPAFNHALALNPDDIDLWTAKGSALYSLRRYEQALAAFESACALRPDLAACWNNKSLALIELKRYDDALACIEQALSRDPVNQNAWSCKRSIFTQQGRYEEALTASERVTELDPANVDNWTRKAGNLAALGRVEEAIAACDEALRLKPDDATALARRRYYQWALHRSSVDQRMRLRDGRWLGYVEYGDPAGMPIFVFHGVPGSRLDYICDDDDLKALHIRLIVPDRPGYGLSDNQPHRRILNWPDDVVDLADHLGLSRFAILGVSGGGAYAAACAYKIPHRLTHVGLVSSVAPSDAPHFDPGTNRIARAMWRYVPEPLMLLFSRATDHLLLSDPKEYYATLLRRLPAADQASLPTWSDNPPPSVIEAAIEPYRNGAKGLNRDMYLQVRPWGFRLEDITIPVFLWHGERDTLVPPAMARYVARTIPNCRPTYYAGEGHTVLNNHTQEILKALTDTTVEHQDANG